MGDWKTDLEWKMGRESLQRCEKSFWPFFPIFDEPRDGPMDGPMDGQTNGWTNGWTDRWTDIPSYRDAWRCKEMHLKTAQQNLVILSVFLVEVLRGAPGWQMGNAPPQEVEQQVLANQDAYPFPRFVVVVVVVVVVIVIMAVVVIVVIMKHQESLLFLIHLYK